VRLSVLPVDKELNKLLRLLNAKTSDETRANLILSDETRADLILAGVEQRMLKAENLHPKVI
jgi:hypothetical protein